jgi:hypothetical protein
MAKKCSEVFLLVKCHQERMSEALSKHLLAFDVLPPVKKKNKYTPSHTFSGDHYKKRKGKEPVHVEDLAISSSLC